MILTSSTNLRQDSKTMAILNESLRRSGALYNSLVYETQKNFEETQKYIGYAKLDVLMKTHHSNPVYRMLPAQCSQQKVKEFHESFKSFFSLSKLKSSGEYKKKVGTPKFKEKGHRSTLTFAKESFRIEGDKIRLAISKDIQQTYDVRYVYVDFPKYIDTSYEVRQIKLKPIGKDGVKLLVQYEVPEVEEVTNIENWASIDFGINNLMTVTSNVVSPIIFNGRPLKSINRYFNKKIAKAKSELKKNKQNYTSNRVKKLHEDRNNQINSEMNKISSTFVEYCMMNNIDLVVIGYNKGWKTGVNIGKKNNQNFVHIPHSKLVQQLQYRLKLKGIQSVIQEESYTSKTSYFDNEPIKKHPTYIGKRTERGLFKTGSKSLINADVNGSLNIARKYFTRAKEVHDVFYRPVDIGFVMNPVVLDLKTSTSLDAVNQFLVKLQIESVKKIHKLLK